MHVVVESLVGQEVRGVVAPVDLRKGAQLVAIRASIASFTESLSKEEITAFLGLVLLLTLTDKLLLCGHELGENRRETDVWHLNRRLCGHKVSRCDLKTQLRLWGGERGGARSLNHQLKNSSVGRGLSLSTHGTTKRWEVCIIVARVD